MLEFIEWKLFHDKKMELDLSRKAPGRFYWHGVMMAFIEWKLFNDKRRDLIVYERLSVDFIG
jgi:hypothetical protein